ncbi:MAG TPA: DUF4153 domain-containing protein [Pelobium sp.]|nr:DUF4153 domain-containing protein [Pelobium sp.]
MKFPSLNQLWHSFLAVCKRFALPILYAVIATIAALVLSYNSHDFVAEQLLAKLIYLGNFGLALSIAFSLYAETTFVSVTKKIIANATVLLILVLIYFTLHPAIRQADVFVLLALGFAFHLLVSFSAFSGFGKEVGFWQMNKTFFLRFATSALYSAVLFVGLSVALLSIKTLFNVRWDSEIYIRLWIVIVGVFNTVFFLAGIPQPLNSLNTETNYPKALKVFTQYVLVPLASIYLLILLAYEAKIILEWSLPNSSVAILILGYSVFGMLSILLVHPIRHQEGNKWIQLYSKSFYLLMLPLLVLLAVAIIKRVSDYGITESRYFLIVLSLWLTFITVYFLIKGREQIRIVPISLFVFSVLIVLGPWGIKSVSRNSQSQRLATFIAQKPSEERNDEIRNLVRHLNENYGSESLQKFVKIDLQAIEATHRDTTNGKWAGQWDIQRSISDTVLTSLNVGNIATANLRNKQQKNYMNAEQGVIVVENALTVVAVNSNLNNVWDKKPTFSLDSSVYSFLIDDDYNLVLSNSNNKKIVFNVDEVLKSLYKNKTLKANKDRSNYLSVPNNLITIEKRLENYTFKLRLEELTAYYPKNTPSKPNNIYYTGYLIVYANL